MSDPKWHGSSYAKDANREDSGRPGHQPVDVGSDRHKVMEKFARNAIRWTNGSRASKLSAGEKAHNAVEKIV